MEHKINYVGWKGHDNLGDEALYEVSKKIFSSYQLVPDNKKHHSKITLFGGGTLFPGWTFWVAPNRYNYAYGVGVKNPSFWGEFHPLMTEQIEKFNFRYIGVRGNTSKKLLDAWGVDSTVVGDPCLLLEPTKYGKRKDTRIAVNVGSDGRVWGGNEKQVFKEMARVCKLLRKMGYHPILIPFCKYDLPHIKTISRATNTKIFTHWAEIQKVLDLIASCHVLFGKRLHSLVFSASTYTPFISIEYRPKCRDFAETMGFEDYSIRTDEFSGERCMAMFNNLLENWTRMEKQLIEKVKTYRRKLRAFGNFIRTDIESLPNNKWTPSVIEKIKWFSEICRRRRLHKLLMIQQRELQLRMSGEA